MFENFDLTNDKDIEICTNNINNRCKAALMKCMNLSTRAVVSVESGHVKIEVGDFTAEHKPLFASEITIYRGYPERKKNASISVPTSGSFTNEDDAPVLRTFHASEILQHWKEVTAVVNNYCNIRTLLETEVFEAHKLNENDARSNTTVRQAS